MADDDFTNLLAAAKALLEARENQMITALEWEALARAVAAAEHALREKV